MSWFIVQIYNGEFVVEIMFQAYCWPVIRLWLMGDYLRRFMTVSLYHLTYLLLTSLNVVAIRVYSSIFLQSLLLKRACNQFSFFIIIEIIGLAAIKYFIRARKANHWLGNICVIRIISRNGLLLNIHWVQFSIETCKLFKIRIVNNT